jgi:hypothetical protein
MTGSDSISPRLRLWWMFPVACGTCVTLLFFSVAQDRDLWLAWSRWVPFGLWPGFNDLWITLQHLRDADAGVDPLLVPDSGFAYPRLVLALRHLGVQYLPTPWVGLFQGLLFTVTAVLVLRPMTWRRAVGTTLIFVMPSVLLGLERGNLDLVLFPICALAAWAWSRSDPSRKLVLPVLVMTGAALVKLYPVFGLFSAAAAESPRRRVYWLLGIGGVAIYWYLIRSELSLIAEKVPVMTVSSWGCLVSFERLAQSLQETNPGHWLASEHREVAALVTYGVLAMVSLVVGARHAPRLRTLTLSAGERCQYWIGAGICCGCFAGANFAYRWVFVLLTLPLLVRAARAAEPIVSRWGWFMLGAVMVGLAAKFSLGPIAFVVVQVANWLCILGLIAGCAALRREGAVLAGPPHNLAPDVDLTGTASAPRGRALPQAAGG